MNHYTITGSFDVTEPVVVTKFHSNGFDCQQLTDGVSNIGDVTVASTLVTPFDYTSDLYLTCLGGIKSSGAEPPPNEFVTFYYLKDRDVSPSSLYSTIFVLLWVFVTAIVAKWIYNIIYK